jgi:hypothetical protein
VRFALLKGWRNYLCLLRLEQARGAGAALFDTAGAADVEQIAEWAEKTQDGSLADLPTPPRPDVWDEVAAEPEAQFVVELGGLEVGGGEVDPHDVLLAADDDQVRAAHHDLDARGFHAGKEDVDLEVFAMLLAVVVWLARLALGGGNGAGRTTVAKELRR